MSTAQSASIAGPSSAFARSPESEQRKTACWGPEKMGPLTGWFVSTSSARSQKDPDRLGIRPAVMEWSLEAHAHLEKVVAKREIRHHTLECPRATHPLEGVGHVLSIDADHDLVDGGEDRHPDRNARVVSAHVFGWAREHVDLELAPGSAGGLFRKATWRPRGA